MRMENGSRRQLKSIRRSSARIMNHLQFEFGLVPTKVNKEDKAAHIQALVDSRDQDSTEPFRQFMLQEHLKNISKEIEQFKNTQEGGQKTRQAILQLISEDGKISSTAMAQRLGINRSAVSKHLKAMKEAQLIRREDPDKGGKWVILK